MAMAWGWGRKDGLWYPGAELQVSKVLRSRETSPSLKGFPCESWKLSFVPKTWVKKAKCVGSHLYS